ncbi:nucleolin isoform X2 [Esox lucius]|uniref:nucleolin isoform X2 n=1 Tax=Esox lucius TaxID=8010 RepID=UPI00147729DA|nr:nucleolin isoform X2 [Esox lucius]
MVKLAKAAKKQANPKKKAPPPPKDVEEESSEEESEEEAPPKPVGKKAVTPAKAAAKPAPKAAKNGKAAKKAESEEEEDDDSEEESEEEAPPPKKTPAKATPAKKTPAKAPAKAEESDEDDEDDDDEESEEEAPPPKKAAAKPTVKVTAAKDESEDDEEEDDDDEDDSEEEEMDTTPVPAAKAKKAGMVKAKDESEEDDDEEDDDEDDEDDDDDEEEDEAPSTPAKRKADNKKETPPAKKAKSEGEGTFCLFVGNLNANKDFDEIKEALAAFFSKKNLEVQDVRLGASKKFGYVDFASAEDMQTAMDTCNGKKFMGQELKLDKARSKENSQEDKKDRDARTLFVKNLPFSATKDDLMEVFADAVEIRVPPGQDGSNRGIAYVEFKTEAVAEKMLTEAQGADVQGRSILVDYTGEKSQKGPRAPAQGAAESKTLIVNNLSYSATEDSLQSAFEGAVSIRVPQNNGRPKGFAFVEFESTEAAKEALESLNGTEIEGRQIRLEFSQNSAGRDGGGRGSGGPTKTLFVRGLSEDTTDQSLRDAFEGATGARVVTDRETGNSKCFGFVDFDSENDCKAAKEAMEGGEIDGSSVNLDYAKPKGDSGGFRGGRGGFGGRGGGRGGGFGRGGFGGGRGGRGGGFRGGRGGDRGGRGGGFRGGRGGGFGDKPQGKKIKFDD